MANLTDKERSDVLNRLARVEGQVRGIGRMVEEDKYCVDILAQISAVTTALDRVGRGSSRVMFTAACGTRR